jgi:hypothetical protein
VKEHLHYFRNSYILTVLGLIGGAWVGYIYSGTIQGALTAMLLTLILSVLEVSLSFDNAVVNATVLKDMTPEWRHRFITWGILIAVFGMRIVFPLVIVSIIANINPWAALMMATFDQEEYAKVMLSSHMALAGFGGAFLLMVALKFFFDHEKDVHWLTWLERPLVAMGKIEAIAMGMCLLTFYILSQFIPVESDRLTLIVSGIFGMVTFVAVDGVSSMLKLPDPGKQAAAKSGLAMFLYLEILDASFSFEGVIGAFALTNNIFVIAIGLGVGAMFVRSMTIYLVEKGTLSKFIYLEHGAFYAIGALALMMLCDVFVHIPEAVTGLIGAVFIGLSFWSSIRYNGRQSNQGA